MNHISRAFAVVALLVFLTACEGPTPAAKATAEPAGVEAVLAEAKASEGRPLNIASSNADCIQPRISLGAVTVLKQDGTTETDPPGVNDLIRVEVTSSSPAPNYMWGRVRITDSVGTTRKILYLFYPNTSTADYGRPAHYVRGELTEGRTVSFELIEAHVFRSGDNCFETDATTVSIGLPEPAEVAPTVIAGAGDREVPPTTGDVARSVGGSDRKEWARQQWTDETTPTDPPVWLRKAHGLYANGEWHELSTAGVITAELVVVPVKLGPRPGEAGLSYYEGLGAQTCRLFVDTGGRVLHGGFLHYRPARRLYRPDRIQGTQADPQVFTFDEWNDTLVVNGEQRLNVAMICRDSPPPPPDMTPPPPPPDMTPTVPEVTLTYGANPGGTVPTGNGFSASGSDPAARRRMVTFGSTGGPATDGVERRIVLRDPSEQHHGWKWVFLIEGATAGNQCEIRVDPAPNEAADGPADQGWQTYLGGITAVGAGEVRIQGHGMSGLPSGDATSSNIRTWSRWDGMGEERLVFGQENGQEITVDVTATCS